MLYHVLQYHHGIPCLVSEWTNRFMAYQQAYELAGLPFFEHGNQKIAHIHSARGMFAVVQEEQI